MHEQKFRGYIGTLYDSIGLYRVYVGLYRDDGKENGNGCRSKAATLFASFDGAMQINASLRLLKRDAPKVPGDEGDHKIFWAKPLTPI